MDPNVERKSLIECLAMRYHVAVNKEDGGCGFHAEIRDLPGCTAYARGIEEACRLIEAERIAWIKTAYSRGDTPHPKPHTDRSFGELATISVFAGNGGEEARDWARMLGDMYMRWAERAGHAYEVIGGVGEKWTLLVYGGNTRKTLGKETGWHRMSRNSPFDKEHRRCTNFSSVVVSFAGERPVASDDRVRTYVFDPYKLVKDLRTGEETTAIDQVLDGDLALVLS